MATVEAWARGQGLPIMGGPLNDDPAQEDRDGWIEAYVHFADQVVFGDPFVSFAEFVRRMKRMGWEVERHFVEVGAYSFLKTLVIPPRNQRAYRE